MTSGPPVWRVEHVAIGSRYELDFRYRSDVVTPTVLAGCMMVCTLKLAR